MFYYAYVDENNTVTGVYALPSQISASGYVEITEQQYNDSQAGNENSLIGKIYNPETGEFSDPVAWLGSTGDIEYKETETSLTAKLDSMDEAISTNTTNVAAVTTAHNELVSVVNGKANTADLHTHSNKTVLDGITAAKVAAWDAGSSGAGAPGADGEDGATFTPSVSADGVLSWTNDKGLTNPTPVNIKGADGEDGADGAPGANGADGADGVSPTVSVSKSGTVTTITITDVNGTHTATINDGADGESGADISASDVLTKLKTVDGQNSGLDADLLDGQDSTYFATAAQLAGKADADHNHDTAYAAANHTHTEYAVTNHNHDTVYSPTNHTHTEYAATDHNHDGTYAPTTHTHDGYAETNHSHSMDDITGLATALNGKSDTNHTHSGYATSNHTHSQYASTNHTHSEYATTSHNHSTLTGPVNVTGAIKSNGVQVAYNSGSTSTVGSDSYPTNVAGTYVTLNGEKTYAPNIYPRNTGTFYLGAQSNRWSGIYSKVAVNVSSDERLKENIVAIDKDEAAKLIKGLDVVNFNFIGSDDKCIGVIAQDILQLSPELAETLVSQGEDGYYGVKTADLIFPLIAYVQHLTKEIENLKK